MSASREKKKRFEERAEGTEKRQVRAKSDYRARRHKKLITSIAAIVVVVLLLVAVVFNSNLFYTGVTAVTAGNTKYTAADFNYEYFNTFYTTYESIYNTYGSYASLLLNPSTALDQQAYSDTMTWQDYFEDQAFTQLQQMAILNDMAEAEGWSLSSEQKAEVEANLDSIKTNAVSNGYSDYRAYIRALYGKGITEERLRSLLEKSFNATYYSQYLADKWMNGYTAEELQAYYDGVRDEYDLVSFMAYFVDSSVYVSDEMDADSALAHAKDVASEIATAGDQDTFAEVVYQNAPEDQKETYADKDACLSRMTAPSSITNATWKSWLLDAQRQSGDSNVIAGENGYYVLLFLERSDNTFLTANFRGIAIEVEKDEGSGEITSATRSAAEAKVNMILEAYNEDPTDENFAELANTYGSVSNGGLYENAIPGQLGVLEAEEWLFDEARQAGDVETFYRDGYYYVICAGERGEQYNLMLAKNLKATDQYNSTIEAAKEAYPVETKFAFRFTK